MSQLLSILLLFLSASLRVTQTNQQPEPVNIKLISTAEYYIIKSIRQMTQTTLVFWGNNQHNLLTPQPNKTFPRPNTITLPHILTDLSASEKHVAFITQDGSLQTYGLNLDGRLGVGAKPDMRCGSSNPVKVKLPAPAISVKCGFSHTCVQLINEELYSWGLGDYGALGTGEFKSRGIPTKVLLKGRIVHFSCGAMHSGFVDSEGSIFTCGSNEYGQLGVNRPEKIATPILVNFSQKVKQIECGVFYTLLLTTKGQVYGMGNNKYGQLGIGHKVNEFHPTLIKQMEGITTIAAGYHSGALDSEGSLYIWGSGSFGQLLKPKKIILQVPIDKIFIRGFFGVGLSSLQQKVYAWGNNTYGELGRGNYQSTKDPVQITDLSSVKLHSFACGVNFFIAATKDTLLAKDTQPISTTERARFSYLTEERKSPYTYGVNQPLQPLRYEASLLREEEALRSAERTARTPTRISKEARDFKARSRSREELLEGREMIAQQIRRSRNRQTSNYQQLFISLSADYQTLLARFKAMEDHLQLKNRSLQAQKEELTLFYQEENQFLRQENQGLKIQLSLVKEQFFSSQQIAEQLKQKQRERIPGQTQTGQTSRREEQLERRKLIATKEELNAVLQQLKEAEEKLAEKKIYLSDIRQKRMSGSDFQGYVSEVKEEVNELTVKNKLLKEQLRSVNSKYQALEEQLAVKSLQLKQLRQKRQTMEGGLKNENQVLTQELAFLNKEFKVTKDELRLTLKKMDEIEQQLAVKSLELKETKQKKILFETTEDLKSEILTQKNQIQALAKDNKALKEELRSANRKTDDIEKELNTKATQIRDLKRKLNTTEQAAEQFKTENTLLSQNITELKEELKKSLKQLDSLEEQIAAKNVELRQQIKKRQQFQADLQHLRLKEIQLTDSLKETTKLLNENEKNYGEQAFTHKKIENDLYQQISTLQGEKIKLVDLCEKINAQRDKLEEALKASEETIYALEKHYQIELNETVGSISKLKEIQQLNQIRANELKEIIETQRKKHGGLFQEVEIGKAKVAELQDQKAQLFKMLEELKVKLQEDAKLYQEKVIQAESHSAAVQERTSEMQIELAYEKQYHEKCEESIRELTENRDKACRQLQLAKQNIQKDKQKLKQLNFQVQKAKTLKKEVEVLNVQLERVQASTRQYRKEIEQILQQKEEILKELRTDLEKKQGELQKLEEKYEAETGSLNRQIKDNQRKLDSKNKENNEIKKQLERRVADIQAGKEALEKANRKLIFKNEEFDKQAREHEKTTEEFNHLRRQYTKLKSEKQDIENQNDLLHHQKQALEQKLVERKRQNQLVQAEVKRLQAIIDNLKKQTEMAKKDLEESNWALEESRRINDELARANKQFADNEEHFTNKISELQGKIFELEDENKSYTPRYQALLERNRQLDEKNRQFSQMINKAIEIQAEAYKTNILKEVEINTGEIIQQIKEQQQYKPKLRRREVPAPKEADPSQIENFPQSRTPGIASKIKEEPYNKLMHEKINLHRKRVSDSAQKLAGILQLGQSDVEGKSFQRSLGMRKQEDYEKINSQMQSLNQQKQEFMEKINNFAEKLKIL